MDAQTATLIGSVVAALGAAITAVAVPYFAWRGNTELAALRVALAAAEATAARREAKIDRLQAELAAREKPYG